ncbi:MAG: hypothetical protein CMP98_08190 [Gammaproteobacteria bacterium]|nr:hypothetical protein [Gammaproteobacteria bacterium]OUU09449.1 MAG: hypothetical protein CBB94_08350 [Gammaproteobacteria bacterium TMED34]
MAGLLGVGKSALSKRLSDVSGATHLGIDSVEQALRDLTGIDVESEGYRLAYRIVADNLALRHPLVADPCNSITRPAMSGRCLQKTSGPDNDTSNPCVRTSMNTGVGLSAAN